MATTTTNGHHRHRHVTTTTTMSPPPPPPHHHHPHVTTTNMSQLPITTNVIAAMGREGEGRGRRLASFGCMGIFLAFIDCTYIDMSTCIKASNNNFLRLNNQKLHLEMDIFTLSKIKKINNKCCNFGC